MGTLTQLREVENEALEDEEHQRDEDSAHQPPIMRLTTRQHMLSGSQHISLVEIEIDEGEDHKHQQAHPFGVPGGGTLVSFVKIEVRHSSIEN